MRFVLLFLQGLILLGFDSPAFAWDEVGKAGLKVGPFPIYNCVLLTPDGKYEQDTTPVRLELTYKRDIRSHHFIKHAKKEWAYQGMPEVAIAASATSLEHAFPDIEKGETLIFETREDGTGHLYHNGEEIFQVDDPNLAQNFVNIWLSEKTSRPKHRERLIGER